MKNIQKISILSISLLTIMASATMTPNLSYIGGYFSTVDEVLIKMVLSLPAIIIIPITLLTGKLVFRFHKKHLLIVGLLLYLMGGLGGALANSIYVLLTFRAVLGIGVGLLLPLTKGLVADFFSGKERAKMMGYSTSVNNLGGIIATVVAGFLTVFGWRFPFLVYATAFIVLFLVVRYLPDQDVEVKNHQRVTINRNVWMLGIGLYMFILIFFAVPSSLGIFIDESGLGTGLTTGLLISLVTIGSLLTGLVFHYIREKLELNTTITGVVILTGGMYFMSITSTILLSGIALVMVGIGLGIVSSNTYLQTSLDSDKQNVTLSLAIVSLFSFLGQFTSPIINDVLQNIFNLHTINDPFTVSVFIGIVTIAAMLLNRVFKVYKPRNE